MHAVCLDLHPAAAAEALLPAPELPVQVIERDRNSGRQASQCGDETLSMRLARRFKAQHSM